VEPLTAAIVEAAARKALAEATVAQGIREVAAETAETLVGEQGLVQQLETIRFGSVESVAARNEATLSEVSQIEANRISGAAREEAVDSELAREYRLEGGYHIERECFLRDETGKITVDPNTGESRRVDFEIIKDGEVVKSVEVTSETADKTAQLAKEERIRDTGGNYIVDHRTGELVRFAPDVKTEVIRRA
jgi:hypothetical protein